ncbi:unnamed protein product [Gordionus sp. m RMFG-2023]
MSRRGRAPKYSHKGKARCFTAPEEMQRQLQQARVQRDVSPSAEEEVEKIKLSDASSSEDENIKGKAKGVQGLIEIENLNRVPIRATKKPEELDLTAKVQLSRKEREVIEKQKAAERYEQLHIQGKTEEARKDLERLAIIRQKREEIASKRLAEKQGIYRVLSLFSNIIITRL